MQTNSFYVATNGNDRHPGTEDLPFATLDRARKAVRAIKSIGGPPGAITVWIRDGVYPCGQTFSLSEADSGTSNAPIVYSAYPGESPRLTGGKHLPASAFQPVTDADVLRRIRPGVRSKVMCADIVALGIRDFGSMEPRGFGQALRPTPVMLYCNGQPMTLARWPADGFALTGPVSKSGGNDAFQLDHERLENWAEAEDPWLYGYWHWEWADEYLPVQSIDTHNRIISTGKPHRFGILEGRRFFILNLIEELEQPGEWYLDREKGIVYFCPPSPIQDAHVVLSTMKDALVSLDGCSHVTLRGLTLEYGRAYGIIMKNGSHNLIEHCVLRNLSTTAIQIGDPWNYEDAAASSQGGCHNGVKSCRIFNIGGAGIILSGGDRKSLEPGHNYVINNHIHDFGQICRTYQPAIEISGVGNRAANNDIHHGPHSAVNLYGNDHLIECNRISHVVLDSDDTGAIYAGRNPSEQGNRIRYNYFGNIGNHIGRGTAAIFLDDGQCGVQINGNIFNRTGSIGTDGFGAIYIHGGRYNELSENIFFECEQAIAISPWDKRRWRSFLEGQFESGVIPRRIRGEDIDINGSLYKGKYPELAWLDQSAGANRIHRNVTIECGFSVTINGDPNCDSYQQETENNQEINLNPGNGYPTLKPRIQEQYNLAQSKIEGFGPIPIERIGLIKENEDTDGPS